jgi:hypothetical protein
MAETAETHIEIQMQPGAVREYRDFWLAHGEIDQSAVYVWIRVGNACRGISAPAARKR